MVNLVATMTDRSDSSRLKRVAIADEGGEPEGEDEAVQEEAVRKNLTL
jgi:hypothetical protein